MFKMCGASIAYKKKRRRWGKEEVSDITQSASSSLSESEGWLTVR